MTTTAHEDQFTAAPEPVRQPYDTVAILKRNVAALEVALKQQTDRAIQSERDFESLISDDNTIQEYAYELGGTDSGEYHLTAQDVARIAAKASEPYTSVLRSLASYVGAGGYNADTVDADVFEEKIRWGIRGVMARMEKAEAELAKLAQQEPIKYLYRVIDCFGHDVLRDDPKGATILETIPLYAAPVPAPAVPEEWKLAVSEFLSSHDAAWAELFKSLPADTRSVTVSNHQADAVRKANALRALLQSAEVSHD